MNSNKITVAVVISLCICLCLFLSKIFGAANDAKAEKIYKQGLHFYNNGDYQNAYYNFNKISTFSSLYSLALFRQASCAWNLNDKRTALRKYSKFAKTNRKTDLASIALWRMALINFDTGHPRKAKGLLNQIRKKHPDTDFAKAASYKLAVLYFDHDKEKAKPYLIEYIEYAPRGRYAFDVLDMLGSYGADEISPEEKMYIARSFYENALYHRALDELKQIPFNYSWVYLAKVYDKLGDNLAFCDTTISGVQLQNQLSKPSDKEIFDIMNLYIEKSALSPKLAAYNLVKATKENSYYALALFLYSKYVDKNSAFRNYEKIYNVYPASIVAPEALWSNFWYLYKNRNYNDAYLLSKKHTNIHVDKNLQPKIMFWSAKISFASGQKKLAKSILQNIIRSFPSSYYAFRANAILRGYKNPWGDRNDKIKADNPELGFPVESDLKEYTLLKKFACLGDYDIISDFKIDDDFINSWLVLKQGNKSYSVVLARDAINKSEQKIPFSSPKFKLAYPLYYKDVINDYSSAYGVDPYLMISLMREESFFNPTAISSTGARGLMQLMPSTAEMVASGFGGADTLYDPDYNISLGIKYFAHLVKEFRGNNALAVLAYNSGPGSVKRWLDNAGDKDFDEFIEDVPYPETANYIKKVYTSYWAYTNIYGKNNLPF